MDAITLLKQDHKEVKALFARFEKAGERAVKTKREIVDRIITELAIHAAVEEQLFYPAVRAAVPDADFEVLEGLEEHHVVKWTLSELETLDPTHERFDAKVTVLIESVRHHIEDEETELFPKVRRALGRSFLAELGDAMEKAKRTAPTRPHPKAPDEPPANIVTGLASGLLDRARDVGRDAAKSAARTTRRRVTRASR